MATYHGRTYLVRRAQQGSTLAMAILTMAVPTRCDALTKDLRVDGWPALTIHGDKAQEVLTLT